MKAEDFIPFIPYIIIAFNVVYKTRFSMLINLGAILLFAGLKYREVREENKK